ncbi:MAG: hypothetical protein ABSE82_05950 [Nitrososphaerales archaeon]
MTTISVTEDRISKLEDDQGIIRARLEEGVVRQRLSRDIYSNPNSGFRELYANEVRACRRATALNPQSKHTPRISVALDYSNRNLVIHGVNSLGIPLQKFKDVLAVLGETDNDSGSEVGQFGMGHMSFRALSDNILFECFSLESGEKYSYLGNGNVYEKLPEPKGLKSAGTRVTVTLRDGVEIGTLEKYVRSVCAYSDVDTFLAVFDEDGNTLKEAEQINARADLSNASSFGIPVEIDDGDFYISGTVGREQTTPLSPTILLIRLPIQAKIIERSMEFFNTCVLNIKDERKYKPAADRERLTDEAQTLLLLKINSRLKQVLASKLDIKTLDDFRNSPCSAFYYRIDYKELCEFYQPSNETKEISEIINLQVKRNGDSEPVKLGNLIQQSKNLFFCNSVVKEFEHVLQKEYDDAVVFKFASKWQQRNGEDDLLRKYGIRTDAEEEIRRIKIKLGREWREGLEPEPRTEPDAPYQITTHESWTVNVERYGSTYHYLSQRANSEDRTAWLNMDKVIFVPDELSKYLDILTEVDCTHKLTKASPKRIPGALTLEKFIAKISTKEVETSEGRKTLSQIGDSGKSVEILVYDDPRLAEVYKQDGGIFVPLEADEAFELAVYCTYSGRYCKIHRVIREGEFYKIVGKSRSNYSSKSWDGRESYEPDQMNVANCAFHVACAVGDKDLVELYLSAMDKELDASTYRDFVISLWENDRNGIQRRAG